MHKASKKINEKELLDLLEAIVLFLHHEGADYLSGENVEEEYGESLAVLSKHFRKMKNRSASSYLLAAINSLFEIKIKESYIDKNSIQFSKFIEDLLSMIGIIEGGFEKIQIKLDNV